VTGSTGVSSDLASDPLFPALKDYLIDHTGLSYYADKNAELADRIDRRLEVAGAGDCTSYLRLLKDGRAGETELDALVEELTIGETYFFRQPELFDALRDVVFPEIIEKNRATRRIRIWSAGCATGPEAYSIAILLKRDLGAALAGWDVDILGTDINRRFLQRAAAGVYDEWAFRATPDSVRTACFRPQGAHHAIAPDYRRAVSFQYHNLVKHPFPSILHDLQAFDLILCRNVMIYFNRDLCRKIISQFEGCLVERGWLALGPSDLSIDLFQHFSMRNIGGAIVHQKPGDVTIHMPPSPQPSPAYGGRGGIVDVMPPAPDVEPRAGAQSLADRGDWDAALRAYERLIDAEPLNASVHFYYALVLRQVANYDASEKTLRHAIYLDRRNALAHHHLGLLLHKRGDAKGAIRSFQNVLSVLAGLPDDTPIENGDGMTVSDLRGVARLNMETRAVL